MLGRFQRLHSQQLTDQELHASVQQRFDRSQWESIARDFDITAAECKFVWEHRAVGGYVRKECHEKRTTPWTECEIRIVERVVSEQWALESKDQTYVGTLTNLRQRRAIDWRSIAHEAGTGRQPGEFFARYKREMIRLRSVDRQHSSRGANSNTTAALPLSSRKRGRTGNEAEAKLKQ